MLRSLVVALSLLGALACTSSAGTAGSGVAAKDSRQVPAFEQLRVNGAFAVEVELGPAPSVRVEADDNIVPLISTEVEGDALVISSRQSMHTSGQLKVWVTTPRLVAVEHSGSGSVQVRGITGERFAAALRGSGSIELTGRVDALAVDLDGSGSLVAVGLIATTATVELAGSGSAEVNASEQLTADVSGSGSVRYMDGAKNVARNVHGSGSVEPM